MTTALDSIPARFELASPETLALAFDATNYLAGTETVQSASFSVTDLNTGADASGLLAGSPSIGGGKLVTQVISAARGGHRYRLVGTLTISATKVLSFQTLLVADF